MRIFLLMVFFVVGDLFSSSPVFADEKTPFIAEDTILISEIMSNAGNEHPEWIELISTAEEEVLLSGYTVSDEKGVIFAFGDSASLSPGEYLVITGWGNKLNNTGDAVVLRNAIGEVIAEHVFPSLSKTESWLPQEQQKGIPTRGEKNREKTSSHEEEKGEEDPQNQEQSNQENTEPEDVINAFSGTLLLSEIMTNPPENESEWIEITSESEAEVSLSGVQIADRTGVFFTFDSGQTISPDEYLVISGWGNKLNNSGDDIFLLDSVENILDQYKDIPSLEKNVSFARQNGTFAKTIAPTRGTENRITHASSASTKTSSPSSSRRKNKHLVRTPASFSSVGSEKIELMFSEVLFRGSEEDFVELYCQKCDVDLGGIRVGDDDVFFEFPHNSILPSGAYIVIHFSKNAKNKTERTEGEWNALKNQLPRKTENTWHYQAYTKGLTATDETLYIIDSRGNIEDALCIANQNGSFSAAERTDMIQLIHMNGLKARHPLGESVCFDSRALQKDVSLVFSGHKSEFSSDTYFASREITMGLQNPRSPIRSHAISLDISQYRRAFGKTTFLITNMGQRKIFLTDIHLSVEGKNIPLPNTHIFPNGTLRVIVDGDFGEVFLLEDTWQTQVWKKHIPLEAFTEGQGDVRIGEIFANPEGEDSGKEFLEIECFADWCQKENTLLFIGETHIPLSEDMVRGEKKALFGNSIRNTDFTATIFNLREGVWESASQKKSVSGESISRFGEEWHASLPTPDATNSAVFSEEHITDDNDNDGIPNLWEERIGSDPFTANAVNDPQYRLFRSALGHHSSVKAMYESGTVLFSGHTLPDARIRLVMGESQKTFVTLSDSFGKYSFSDIPDIPAGKHDIDMIITPPSGNVIIFSEKGNITLTENPADHWITDVSISVVLPNPRGKDTGRETIILQNMSNHSGVLSGAEIASGTTRKRLPDMHFGPFQKKILGHDKIPQLKNAEGEVTLSLGFEKIISRVSWKKARNGEWIGPDAPRYSVESTSRAQKAKKRKSTSKIRKTQKTQKRRPPFLLPEEEVPRVILGKIVSLSSEKVAIMGGENEVMEYLFADNIREPEMFLGEGADVVLEVLGGYAQDIAVQTPNIWRPAPLEYIPRGDTLPVMIIGFCFLFFLGLSRVLCLRSLFWGNVDVFQKES